MVVVGKVKPKDICVIALGNRSECALIEAELLAEQRGIELVRFDPSSPACRFLSFRPGRDVWAGAERYWVSDFVRAWIGQQLRSYVWVDSDVLAQKPLDELMAIADEQPGLSIASERGTHFKRLYFQVYQRAYGALPFARHDASGPLTYNCGVLAVQGDFTARWRAAFLQLRKLITSGPAWARRTLSTAPDLGQMAWNFVAWKARASQLDGKFNTFNTASAADRRRAVLVHYPQDGKRMMVEDYVGSALFRK